MVIVEYIRAPKAKHAALMKNAVSTPYADTTNPPMLAPKHNAALQVALFNAFAVNNSFSLVTFGIDALSAGMNTACNAIKIAEIT